MSYNPLVFPANPAQGDGVSFKTNWQFVNGVWVFTSTEFTGSLIRPPASRLQVVGADVTIAPTKPTRAYTITRPRYALTNVTHMRLITDSTYGYPYMSIAEFQLYANVGDSSGIISSTTTATFSTSSNTGTPPANMLDGNAATYWQDGGWGAGPGRTYYLQFAFPSTLAQISEMAVTAWNDATNGANAAPKRLYVQTSTDGGATYTQVADVQFTTWTAGSTKRTDIRTY